MRDLLGRMTLEEKFWQLFMIPGDLDDPSHDYSRASFGLQISTKPSSADAARAHAERINAIQRFFVERTRLGIPIIPFDEAVHGLRARWRDGVSAGDRAGGDVGYVARGACRRARLRARRDRAESAGPLAGDQHRERRAMGPGRGDIRRGSGAHLAMGAAFIDAFERAGVVATPKHFIANVGEGGRDSYPIDLNERTLEELFFPPFNDGDRRGARAIGDDCLQLRRRRRRRRRVARCSRTS